MCFYHVLVHHVFHMKIMKIKNTELYQCDSTYCIDTDSISIAFALEVLNHKRLDLLICNSQLQDYKDENCTLLKQSK